MKSRPRVIAPAVLEQVRQQMLFIAEHSIENALAWEDRVIAAMRGLSDFHAHSVDAPASSLLGYTVRKLVFEKTYLVHYRVDEPANLVREINFRHGARLPRVGEP